MTRAFWLASPPARMVSASVDSRARKTDSQSGKRRLSASYVRSELTSLVACERMVATSMSSGSQFVQLLEGTP
jgi:hypothetical protein